MLSSSVTSLFDFGGREQSAAASMTYKLAGAGIILFVALLLRRFILPLASGRNVHDSADPKSKVSPLASQFPPSRRHVLSQLPQTAKQAVNLEIPHKTLTSRALPTSKTSGFGKGQDDGDYYTPTGFSTSDIAAIGPFPDYALLSGVRDPVPVPPDWDISKARFRPYRPFRWGYHQHMGLFIVYFFTPFFCCFLVST